NHWFTRRLELQPQSLSGELHQRRHLSACRDEIAHQFAATDLVLTERDRRHKVLHLEIFDKGVTGIEPTRRPQQSVALKSQLSPNCGPLFHVARNGRTHSGQNAVVRMPDTCRGETIVRLKV